MKVGFMESGLSFYLIFRRINFLRSRDFMLFKKPRHIKDLSDEELARAYKRSRDTSYVGELYERYTHMVFLVCMKYVKVEEEAEDLSMQIFEKLMSDLGKYEVRAFKYWLHTVCKNHCLAFLEKKKKIRQQIEVIKEESESSDEIYPRALMELLDREESLNRLESAIAQLKEGQKDCVELFYLEKKSYQEVAHITGYSIKQVKSFIENGKRNLKILSTKIAVDDPQ